MVEYCSVTYAWLGRGWTQEIEWLRIKDEELIDWRGHYWVDFLNYMARDSWELVSTIPLGGGENSIYGVAACFKRLI